MGIRLNTHEKKKRFRSNLKWILKDLYKDNKKKRYKYI